MAKLSVWFAVAAALICGAKGAYGWMVGAALNAALLIILNWCAFSAAKEIAEARKWEQINDAMKRNVDAEMLYHLRKHPARIRPEDAEFIPTQTALAIWMLSITSLGLLIVALSID